MKKLFLIFMFFALSIISTSVQAQGYSKKIIFGTFSQKISAQRELNFFRAEPAYAELYKLALQNGFTVHARPLADYTILAAEPINNQSAFIEALKLIKMNYPHAYHISAEGFDEKIEKPLAPRTAKASGALKTPKKDASTAASTVTAQQPKSSKAVATTEKSIFQVEEVKTNLMMVNCQSANEKVEKIKEILKEEPKKEPKPEIKQEVKVEHKTENVVEQKPEAKAEPTAEVKQEEPKQTPKTVAPQAKEESFFASILKYFTSEEPEIVAQEPQKAILGVEIPDLSSNSQETSDEAEVPELSKSQTPSMENIANKMVEKPEVHDLTSNDTQSMSDEAEVPELSDMSVDKNKSEPLKQELQKASIVEKPMHEKKVEPVVEKPAIEKKVESIPETTVAKEPEIKESAKAPAVEKKADTIPNMEKVEEEDSYFTFMNFVLLMLLVGGWFAYKKFKKVYDEY